MLYTTCNPGSHLAYAARLERKGNGKVFDNDSGEEVSLDDLLRTFGYDPSEKLYTVEITIQPVRRTMTWTPGVRRD